MIVLSNTAAQTLQPGQALVFDRVVSRSGCGECHRANGNSVKLCRKNVTYDVSMSANIRGTAVGSVVDIGLALGTDILRETVMESTTPSITGFNNVATRTYLKNCCCDFDRLSLVNVGTTPVVVGANTALAIDIQR